MSKNQARFPIAAMARVRGVSKAGDYAWIGRPLYTSLAFGGRCREAGVRPSMGSVGDAHDNAKAESVFSSLECELLARRRFRSRPEARTALFSDLKGFANPVRHHSALGDRSPSVSEQGHHPQPVTETLVRQAHEPSTETGRSQTAKCDCGTVRRVRTRLSRRAGRIGPAGAAWPIRSPAGKTGARRGCAEPMSHPCAPPVRESAHCCRSGNPPHSGRGNQSGAGPGRRNACRTPPREERKLGSSRRPDYTSSARWHACGARPEYASTLRRAFPNREACPDSARSTATDRTRSHHSA